MNFFLPKHPYFIQFCFGIPKMSFLCTKRRNTKIYFIHVTQYHYTDFFTGCPAQKSIAIKFSRRNHKNSLQELNWIMKFARIHCKNLSEFLPQPRSVIPIRLGKFWSIDVFKDVYGWSFQNNATRLGSNTLTSFSSHSYCLLRILNEELSQL